MENVIIPFDFLMFFNEKPYIFQAYAMVLELQNRSFPKNRFGRKLDYGKNLENSARILKSASVSEETPLFLLSRIGNRSKPMKICEQEKCVAH